MEYIVLLIMIIIIYGILSYIFDIKIKELKKIGEDKELDDLTQKYPDNIEICKSYLKMLNNEDVQIEEDKKSNSTLYLVATNKIFIANLRNSYTRIQTIAHECLHSIQAKKILWFNFVFSNIYIFYFILISIFAIANKLQNHNFFLIILIIFGFIFCFVRSYLEMDAMIKARFLAEKYMKKNKILTEEQMEQILFKYDELNDKGIKITIFQFFKNTIVKVLIFALICIFKVYFNL